MLTVATWIVQGFFFGIGITASTFCLAQLKRITTRKNHDR